MRADVLRGRFAAADTVIYAVLEGEGVLLNTQSGVYFGLDAVGARIWELLQDGTTHAALVRQLLTEYEVDERQLAVDVKDFLRSLAAKHLIHAVDAY
jgi:hypothetical protein